MPAPLVTVSLPTIGRVQFLGALRAAIEAQTFRDFEILFLDNGCPPEARNALCEWARADVRARHLPVDERLPMFANFNRGLARARGKYIVTINDDDLYAPRFLERTVALAENHPKVGFVGTNLDFIDVNGAVLERRRRIRRTTTISGREYVRRLMRSGRNLIRVAGTLFRRSALDPRGFDERLSLHWGDLVIMMRVAERHDVGLVREPLVLTRRHSGQASISSDHAARFHLLAMQFRDYIAEYRRRWPNDEAFAMDLEAAFARSNRIMTLWGWLTAPDDGAAEDCLDALAETPINVVIQAVLGEARRIGLDVGVRHTMAPFVRSVGNLLYGP